MTCCDYFEVAWQAVLLFAAFTKLPTLPRLPTRCVPTVFSRSSLSVQRRSSCLASR